MPAQVIQAVPPTSVTLITGCGAATTPPSTSSVGHLARERRVMEGTLRSRPWRGMRTLRRGRHLDVSCVCQVVLILGWYSYWDGTHLTMQRIIDMHRAAEMADASEPVT
jgi:hypothetical protein